MADLPELNESQIGFIQYWDFLSHGASTIEPTEVLSYDSINTYEQYDNGVQGTLEYNFVRGGSREFNWRVVNNGWILTWMGRENSFNARVADRSNLNGYWDIIDDWTSNSPQTFPATTLSNEIDNLRQELSNSDETTFTHNDVGLYNFEFESATRITLMSESISYQTGSYGSNFTGGLSYVQDVDVVYHAVTAMANYNGDPGSTSCGFEGTTIAATGCSEDSSCYEFGVIDALGNGLVPDAGVTYRNEGQSANGGTDDSGRGSICHLSIQE